MPEHARLDGCLDQIDVEFVKRETIPRLLITLDIHLRPTCNYFNIVYILDYFDVEQMHSTVHNATDIGTASDVSSDR